METNGRGWGERRIEHRSQLGGIDGNDMFELMINATLERCASAYGPDDSRRRRFDNLLAEQRQRLEETRGPLPQS